MSFSRRLFCMAMLLASAALGNAAHAYNLFGPYPWGDEGLTYYNKWGDIFTPGSHGGTITWSIMPDGTTIDPNHPEPGISGTSSLHALMTELGYEQSMATIRQAFQQWSDAANIYFEEVTDSGLPFKSPDGAPPATGHIRLGAFSLPEYFGAVGFAPPPNGGLLEGEILFNADNNFQFAEGNEGGLFNAYINGLYHNDFSGLILHEIGHAVGLDHTDLPSVMTSNPAYFQTINRILDPDDIAGVQFLYGAHLAADFDHDNIVDGDDLAAWKTGFGATSNVTPTMGDADRNGQIDGADFLIWQREASPSMAASAIPEPSGAILALGLLTAASNSRRRHVR